METQCNCGRFVCVKTSKTSAFFDSHGYTHKTRDSGSIFAFDSVLIAYILLNSRHLVRSFSAKSLPRDALTRAKRGIAIACRTDRLSVCPSVCDVGVSGSHSSEILETNCTDT